MQKALRFGVVSILLLAASHSLAQTGMLRSGSSSPVAVTVGLQRHPAATEGLGPTRSSRTHLLLPETTAVVFHRHVPFGIMSFAVAEGGRMVAVSSQRDLLELDSAGKVSWTRSLPGNATSPVTLTSSGTRLVVTDEGWLLGFDPLGGLQFEVRPTLPRPDMASNVLPLPDGSFVLANLTTLSWYEADGQPRASATLSEPIDELVLAQGRVIAVARSRSMFAWDGNFAPESVGAMEGQARSPIVAVGDIVVGLTATGVQALNPRTHATASWVTDLEIGDGGALTAASDDTVLWLSSDNALTRAGRDGQSSKVPLGPQTSAAPEPVAVVSGPEGRVALINALGELALVDSEGTVTTDSEARCSHVVALVPQKDRRLVLACKGGSVWAFGR